MRRERDTPLTATKAIMIRNMLQEAPSVLLANKAKKETMKVVIVLAVA